MRKLLRKGLAQAQEKLTATFDVSKSSSTSPQLSSPSSPEPSIKPISPPLPRSVTLLIGLPGVGKTQVLDLLLPSSHGLSHHDVERRRDGAFLALRAPWGCAEVMDEVLGRDVSVRVVFVVALDDGVVRPEDVVMVDVVLRAVKGGTNNRFGVIVNGETREQRANRLHMPEGEAIVRKALLGMRHTAYWNYIPILNTNDSNNTTAVTNALARFFRLLPVTKPTNANVTSVQPAHLEARLSMERNRIHDLQDTDAAQLASMMQLEAQKRYLRIRESRLRNTSTRPMKPSFTEQTIRPIVETVGAIRPSVATGTESTVTPASEITETPAPYIRPVRPARRPALPGRRPFRPGGRPGASVDGGVAGGSGESSESSESSEDSSVKSEEGQDAVDVAGEGDVEASGCEVEDGQDDEDDVGEDGECAEGQEDGEYAIYAVDEHEEHVECVDDASYAVYAEDEGYDLYAVDEDVENEECPDDGQNVEYAGNEDVPYAENMDNGIEDCAEPQDNEQCEENQAENEDVSYVENADNGIEDYAEPPENVQCEEDQAENEDAPYAENTDNGIEECVEPQDNEQCEEDQNDGQEPEYPEDEHTIDDVKYDDDPCAENAEAELAVEDVEAEQSGGCEELKDTLEDEETEGTTVYADTEECYSGYEEVAKPTVYAEVEGTVMYAEMEACIREAEEVKAEDAEVTYSYSEVEYSAYVEAKPTVYAAGGVYAEAIRDALEEGVATEAEYTEGVAAAYTEGEECVEYGEVGVSEEYAEGEECVEEGEVEEINECVEDDEGFVEEEEIGETEEYVEDEGFVEEEEIGETEEYVEDEGFVEEEEEEEVEECESEESGSD